jgi:hypothetical protein
MSADHHPSRDFDKKEPPCGSLRGSDKKRAALRRPKSREETPKEGEQCKHCIRKSLVCAAQKATSKHAADMRINH